MLKDTVTFTTQDRTVLEGIHYKVNKPHTALLMNSGTGIQRRFYNRFATYATEKGFAVLTYDYRGIGGSAPKSLRSYKARYRDWGHQDIPAAISYLKEKHQNIPLVAVCHSAGGQQLGLAENVSQVQAALFVAVSTGYWRGMFNPFGWLSLFLWKLYLPISSKLFGYARFKLVGYGENLPSGVAKEWGTWCMEHDYVAAYFDNTGRHQSFDGLPFGPTYYKDVKFPIRAYCFTDDYIATKVNVPPTLSLFENSELETMWMEPEAIGASDIGHLGFFRKNIGSPLWDDALNWLEEKGRG